MTCARCARPGLAAGQGLSTRLTRTHVLERWGDFGRLRTTTVFATREDVRLVEGFASVAPAPLLAVTSGRVRSGKDEIRAARVASRQARRDYLWELPRPSTRRDPLLVLRAGPGEVHLRVFPIAPGTRTVAILEGFALLPAADLRGVRIYRQGDTYLAVLPLADVAHWDPDLVDEEGQRAVYALTRRECTRRFPEDMKTAIDVPCARALECAIFDVGEAAVCWNTALMALPPGRHAPRNLYVGEARNAPLLHDPALPPGQRGRPDPTPPQPPPSGVTAVQQHGG